MARVLGLPMTQTQKTKRTLNLFSGFLPWKSTRVQTRFGVRPIRPGEYKIVAVGFEEDVVHSVNESTLSTSENAKTVLNELRYNIGAETVLALPRDEAILKWVRLPSTDAMQIAKMAPHEARTLSPWPAEETAVGHHTLFADDDGYTHMVLILVRHEMIREHLQNLKECGLQVTHIEVSTFSLGRILNGVSEDEPIGVMHVEDDHQEFIRLSRGYPLFSRGAKTAEAPILMLQHSMELDQRRHGQDAEYAKIIVCGDDTTAVTTMQNEWDQLVPLLAAKDLPLSVLNGLSDAQSLDMTCVGATLVDGASTTTSNLLPAEEARSIILRKLLRQTCMFAVTLIWIAATLFGLGRYYFIQERQYVDDTQRLINQLKAQVGDLDVQSKQVELLAGEFEMVSLPLRIVLELHELTPNRIALNYMQYDSRRSLVLSGESPSYPEVLSFLTHLQKSKLLYDVSMNYSTRTRTASGGAVDFKVTCQVRRK